MIPIKPLLMRNASSGYPYWRLFVTNNNGGTVVQVGDIVFKDAGGSTIPTTGGTATASSIGAGSSAAAAFDSDNSGTSWLATSAANEWVAYQFASPVSIAKVIPYTYANAIAFNRAAKDCKLQCSSDGSTWTDVFSFTNYLPVLGYGETYPYVAPASGYHRAWRLLCDNANGSASGMRIDELELRATAGGTDQTNGTANSSEGNTVGRAIGSTGSYWQAFNDTIGSIWSATTNANEWIGFVFPAAVKVEEISITGYTDGTRTPKDMHLQYSDDGITWTTQKNFASQTGWAASETRVLTAI